MRVGPRREPWGMPALISCTSEDCSLKMTFVDLIITEKTFPEISQLASLCRNPLRYTLLKDFEIAILSVPKMCLLSSSSLILYVIIVKEISSGSREAKPILFVVFVVVVNNFLVDDSLKILSMRLKKLMGVILWQRQGIISILMHRTYTRHLPWA